MMVVISLFGLIRYPEGLLLIPLAFLTGLAFGCIGMCFTSIIHHIDLFNLPFFLFITPMFLFSGTFFPLENLPLWAQKLSLILPLTHVVSLTRDLCYGRLTGAMVGALSYLCIITVIFFWIALVKMRSRLIK